MQHPAIGHDDAKSAVTFREMRIRITFNVLTFDDDGYFDASTFDRHQRARAEQRGAKLGEDPTSVPTVIDAASRFVAQGGSWKPSGKLQRVIDQAALGRVKCERL